MKTRGDWVAKFAKQIFLIRLDRGGATAFEAFDSVDLATKMADKLEHDLAAPWKQQEDGEELRRECIEVLLESADDPCSFCGSHGRHTGACRYAKLLIRLKAEGENDGV